MSASCCGHAAKFDGLDPRYKRTLWLVIAINAAMFVVELAAGVLAGSQALQADALDFLGDTLTYGLSLAVIGMSLRIRATAALAKGISLTLMGLWVFGSTAYHVLILGVPRADIMGIIGFLALAANVGSVLLLLPYKDGDANVRSVWLCSRNDAIGNVAVMIAALGVWGTSTAWPDLTVAAIMAGLFLWSSLQILTQALHEYRSDDMTEPDMDRATCQRVAHDGCAGIRSGALLFISWLTALVASLAALFIGEVMGRAPCVLCWYQRAFMFPLAIILAVASFRADASVWRYALPLAAGGWLIAAFHTLQYAGVIPPALEPCGAGPSCTSGDMTIPRRCPSPCALALSVHDNCCSSRARQPEA